MKISKKRFEEILLEEVKVFVQEKKLEEEDYPEMGSEEYEVASAKRRKEIGGGLFGDWRQKRFDAEKKAREGGASLATIPKAIRTAGQQNEGCGDMPAPKKTMKIKIKR
jgi:hypothetical protein